MLGERIKLARKGAGLSLQSLGDAVGLTKMTLSKFERGQQTPSSKQLIALAKVMKVRTEYFFRQQRVQLDKLEYRKRTNTPKKLLDKITADICEQMERWEELLSLYPASPIETFTLPADLPTHIESLDDIDAVAEQMQDAWQLGRNPIPDLTDTLEAHGILVIVTDQGDTDKFDGLAAVVNGKPIVSVNRTWPGDRQRFTLAHELGHWVLKGRLSTELNEENACNRFAGAFLCARQAVVTHFGEHRSALELQELYLLKHEFGISMGGCLFRLLQSKVITQTVFQQWRVLFNKNGWHKQEPSKPYPAEKTIFFKQLVYRGLAENYFGEAKAAELLGIPLLAFHQQRQLEHVDASAYQ